MPVYRTPGELEQNSQSFPDSYRDRSDGSANPEEEGVRRPTLYLILDPDQDPPSSSGAMMLVGTKEELRGKTGGGDVF